MDLSLTSGEFTLYDHVLDHSAAFNAIPPRYQGLGLSDLDMFFAMGRGRQADGVDVPASEMLKWYGRFPYLPRSILTMIAQV
jgi:5-methyltetrahydropteroyltriglutamate--homocysteine methyltransferase